MSSEDQEQQQQATQQPAALEKLLCEFSGKEAEYFNPVSKKLVCTSCIANGSSVGVRCQDIPTAVADHNGVFERIHNEGKDRLKEFDILETHLTQQLSVVDVRENDSLRRLKQEADRLVTLIRRREEELTSLVTTDCEQQRNHITQSLNSIKASKVLLEDSDKVFTDARLSGGKRLRSVYEAEALLKTNNMFLLPDSSQYSVSSRAIVPEAHLSLTRQQSAMHPPHGCSIAMSERVALQATGGAGGDGSSSIGGESMPTNIECPSGLLHFLATGGGTREYINPVSSNLLNISCDVASVEGEPANLADERSNLRDPQSSFRSKSCENTKVVFDFKDRRVQIHSYMLQHGHEREHAALRSWKILGSNAEDGEEEKEENWTLLDAQNNCRLLGNGSKSYSAATFHIEGVTDIKDHSQRPTYRRIAIVNTGPDAAGMHHIELARAEFYGRLLA